MDIRYNFVKVSDRIREIVENSRNNGITVTNENVVELIHNQMPLLPIRTIREAIIVSGMSEFAEAATVEDYVV